MPIRRHDPVGMDDETGSADQWEKRRGTVSGLAPFGNDGDDAGANRLEGFAERQPLSILSHVY